MLTYPEIDAVVLEIGPFKIYWYGVLYLVSFALAWFLAKFRARRLSYQWDNETVSDFIFYAALGVFIGGRLGSVLFYNFNIFIHDPLFIFKVWLGGMSFHGGLLGVIVALYLFARKFKVSFIDMLDFAAVLTPPGLALGRIGNFINSELWGRVTDVSWGMLFPNGGELPRHPSQLYEAFGEGVLLFLVLWIYALKPRPKGAISGLFLFGYGLIRFVCEFFREPDPQFGYIAFNWLTMGQILSVPMVLGGAYIFYASVLRKKRTPSL